MISSLPGVKALLELHMYDGSIDQSAPCGVCGGPARHPNHIINAGTPCDMLEGPCACGAWH